MQNKKPLNDKGQAHGLWERYYSNGNLEYKGLYVNGKRHGLCESYWSNGKSYYKGSFIKGKQIGLWLWYSQDLSRLTTKFYAR